MTSNGLFIDLPSVNTKYMNVRYNVGHLPLNTSVTILYVNVGCKLGHYMKSRS